jgi:probable rRNA maturation factor
VHISTHGIRHSIPRRLLTRVGTAAMREIGCLPNAQLEVALTDDATIARLNRQFLRHHGPTDVITFPGDGGAGDPVIGEVVISLERARAQARRAGWPLRREVALLLAHGVLHLGGFDDHAPRPAAAMRAREQAVLARVFRARR